MDPTLLVFDFIQHGVRRFAPHSRGPQRMTLS